MNKTKKIISKIISILLVVFIAVPFFPISAKAETSITFEGGHGVVSYDNDNYLVYYPGDSVKMPIIKFDGEENPAGYTKDVTISKIDEVGSPVQQDITRNGRYKIAVSYSDSESNIYTNECYVWVMNPLRYSVYFHVGEKIYESGVYHSDVISPKDIPSTEIEGYRFDGWYSDEDFSNSFDVTAPVAPYNMGSPTSLHEVRLYAKMTKLTKVDEVAPTCTEDGTAEYWKDAAGNIFADTYGQEELDMPETIPATGHKWGDPVYTWSDDESEVTASRKCKNDASHVETETVKTEIVVVKEPTDTEDGILQVIATFKNSAFEKQVREYGFNKNAEDEYALISELTEWIKGGKDPLSLRFKNLTDDEGTFDQFLGIKVDDELVSEDNYTKEKGSVIVNLKPEYLEKLSVGEHTIEAMFIYGSVKAKFTIKEAKATEVKAAEAKKEAAKSNATKTGDSSPLLIAIIVMAVSALAIVTMIVVKKKKKN